MTGWFARPVFRVADVAASLAYYARLGFTSPWSYDEDGAVAVAQVDRAGCSIILASNVPATTGLVFVSLNVEPDTIDAQVAALDELRAEFEAHGIRVADRRWGYRLLVVEDLDGNQLYFNYPNVTEST